MNFASFFDIIPSANLRQFIQYVFLSVLMTSCLGTKFLEENERIISKDARVRGIRSSFRDEIRELTVQQPNSRFLQLPIAHQVFSYEIGERNFDPSLYEAEIIRVRSKFEKKITKTDNSKRINRLQTRRDEKIRKLQLKVREGNWLMQNGEPLAVLDSSTYGVSESRIQQYLSTQGFFDNEVEMSARMIGDEKSRLRVIVEPGEQYAIDSLTYTVSDTSIRVLYEMNLESSVLKPGMNYDQSKLEEERERVYKLLVNNGYYGFSKQLISFNVDTTSLDEARVVLTTRIANIENQSPKQFKVDSVIFLSESNIDVSRLRTTDYKDVTYRFGDRLYDPQVLDWRLFIFKDSLFSTESTLETQRQLSYLDAFKFVNINYDSTLTDGLVASIFTSPLNRFQANYEIGGVTAGQLPGPFLNIGLKNRNTFGGLEITNFTASAALQGISGVSGVENYSLLQYSGEVSVTFPQILFPASEKFKYSVGRFNPKTQFALRYEYEDRLGEYERSVTQGSFRYIWSSRDNIQFSLSPLSLSFIDVSTIESSFREVLNEQDSLGNGTLLAAFNSSFISSSSFETIFNFNDYSSYQSNSMFLRLFAETGGNFVGELAQRVFATPDDFAFFKWLKLSADFRALGILPSRSSIAFRFNIGAAYPYERSNLFLPYDKRFYVGGSNSMRAWRVRRLGPGAYGEINEGDPTEEPSQIRIINDRLEQGGDMVIETNIEYRKKILKFVDYALFMDIGNIWLINSDQQLQDIDGDDGVFRFNEFYRELAVNVGLGLRVDFSFLVFRLDGAVKVVDPAQAPGQRWVIDNLNLLAPFGGDDRSKELFRRNTNLSIGIGFPF